MPNFIYLSPQHPHLWLFFYRVSRSGETKLAGPVSRHHGRIAGVFDPLPIDAPHHVEFELDVLDLSCRAQVDPAKPPPITTTSGPLRYRGCTDQRSRSPAAAEPINSRRWICLPRADLLPLCLVPVRDGLDLGLGISPGDPIHHGRVALTRSKRAHLCHDFLGVAASECRNACFSSGACWMAAIARPLRQAAPSSPPLPR
jgi:hypothetical protein